MLMTCQPLPHYPLFDAPMVITASTLKAITVAPRRYWQQRTLFT